MRYKAGYAFQLHAEEIALNTGIRPRRGVTLTFLRLSVGGDMKLKKGYACDGPSRPAFRTKNFMRGAFFHDAFYQLIRLGELSEDNRDKADRLLQKMCIEDGMSQLRAWWIYKGLKWFGSRAAHPDNIRPVLIAP